MMFGRDFNKNVLDYKYNRTVKSFFGLMYQSNLIATIYKPTSVGKTQQRLLTTS